MYLILGDPRDLCCLGVQTALEAHNYPTRVIANPLVHPVGFAWWLDNQRSTSQLGWEGETPIPEDEITGVLVRSNGWLEPAGWEPKDLAYMQAETQAALLAWLWNLHCPVVNRYPPENWYRPQPPLLAWYPLLRRCGLPIQEMLVTNVEKEARMFGHAKAQEGVSAVVYGPLSTEARYLVTRDQDWNGLSAMERYTPVYLTYPHGAPQFVCVVGRRVIWQGEPSHEIAMFESVLIHFAQAAGLDFVELAFASTSGSVCVIAVEPQPRLEHFDEVARERIVEALVQILTSQPEAKQDGVVQFSQGRLL